MIPEKILVMHTGGWIGDMILLTPALRALRRQYSESHISMLVLPLVQELMARNPYLDEIIVYDKHNTQRGFQQLRLMANKLKSKQFQTAIVLHPNSVSSGILAYMAGIPKRIGLKFAGSSIFLTTKVERQANIHEVQRYLNIVKPAAEIDQNNKLEFWGIKDEDENFAKQALSSYQGKSIIGINISTTWPSKQWQTNSYANLIDSLSDQFNAKIILTGGKSDLQLSNEIMKKISIEVLNFIGKTTLWELGALINHCNLYVTADSGPMHISSAIGTPTIALFGPTDPVYHGPYGEGHTVIWKKTDCSPCYERECKTGDNACMQSIKVEDVIKSVNQY